MAQLAPFTVTTDCGDVTFAPITPASKPLLQHGFRKLSRESRYARFFNSQDELTEKELEYLTHVDQQKHVAWGAIVNYGTTHEEGIGVGRYILLPERPHCAEFALTVIDDYQQSGIGSMLFGILYLLGVKNGVQQLYGEVLSSNHYALNRLTALGATSAAHQGVYEVNIPLYPDWDKQLNNGYAKNFSKHLKLLQDKLFR